MGFEQGDLGERQMWQRRCRVWKSKMAAKVQLIRVVVWLAIHCKSQNSVNNASLLWPYSTRTIPFIQLFPAWTSEISNTKCLCISLTRGRVNLTLPKQDYWVFHWILRIPGCWASFLSSIFCQQNSTSSMASFSFGSLYGLLRSHLQRLLHIAQNCKI